MGLSEIKGFMNRGLYFSRVSWVTFPLTVIVWMLALIAFAGETEDFSEFHVKTKHSIDIGNEWLPQSVNGPVGAILSGYTIRVNGDQPPFLHVHSIQANNLLLCFNGSLFPFDGFPFSISFDFISPANEPCLLFARDLSAWLPWLWGIDQFYIWPGRDGITHITLTSTFMRPYLVLYLFTDSDIPVTITNITIDP